MKPVEITGQHDHDRTASQILQAPLKLRPPLPTPRADIIIDVQLINPLAAPLREATAILNLPRNPELSPSRSEEIRA